MYRNRVKDSDSNVYQWSFKTFGIYGNRFDHVLGMLVYLMKKAASASKRTSRQTQGLGESYLIFDYDPEMDDDDMDVQLAFE